MENKKVINLGYVNGWNIKTISRYKDLHMNMIVGTLQTEKLGRCESQTKFESNMNGEIVIVTFKTDSI